MKISILLFGLGVIGALAGGCSSSASRAELSAQQRVSMTTGDKSIPAPAQNLVAQQDMQKRQMDSMRAADAKNAR
ncbi:hypothetical protein EON83_01130 [bacterium]|nr:MAG: hypothetical protein EON83_01130 [bacterium]